MYSLVDIANKNNLTIEELSDKVKSLAYTYYALYGHRVRKMNGS